MRIDAHQHFWRYNPQEYECINDSMSRLRRDFLPEDLKAVLELAGFDGAIAVQARQTLEETRWLLELAESLVIYFGRSRLVRPPGAGRARAAAAVRESSQTPGYAAHCAERTGRPVSSPARFPSRHCRA